MIKREKTPVTALALALSLLLGLSACGTAPASPPSGQSVENSAVPAPEPVSVPAEEPEPQPEAPAEYRAPVSGVEWVRGNNLEGTWEVHYPVPMDTPVCAPVPGEVAELSDESIWPWGKYVVIQAAEDVQVRVCHLKEVDAALAVGSRVGPSTRIGLAGRTGNVQDGAVGVVVSRKDEEGAYRSVFLNQCDCLLAGPLEGVSYAPPVEGKQTDLRDEDPWDANELYYRAGSTGLPVYSPVAGEVAHIQSDSQWPYGRWVTIQAGEDLQVLVTHLSQAAEGLKVGDPVDHETQIGLTGTSGNTTYPTVGVTVKRKVPSGEYRVINVALWDAVFDNWTGEEFLR